MNDIETEKLIESLDENSVEYDMLKRVDTLLDDLRKRFNITEEESMIIDGECTGYILNQSSKEECAQNLAEHLALTNTDKNRQQVIVDTITSFLAQKENKQEAKVAASGIQPTNVLQSLTQPTTLAPTKRDYSLDATSTKTEQPSATKQSIDPYREIPEN